MGYADTMNVSEGSKQIKASVLLVDDDVLGTEVRAAILRSYGFQVVCAYNSDDGLRLAASGSFPVAILDFDMPVVNGCKLAQEIISRRIKIKLIMLSGHLEPPPESQGLFFAFISKGESIECLLKVLKSGAASCATAA